MVRRFLRDLANGIEVIRNRACPASKRERKISRTISLLLSAYEGPKTGMASLAILRMGEIIADSFSTRWIESHMLDISFLKAFGGKTMREFLNNGELEQPLNALVAFYEGAYI
jgi:hypothetical protein